MGSQFVDLDGDGHVDYLTATFDGSPHVARGGEAGFGEPQHLKDASGARVILNYFWDHEKKQHLVDHRAMPTQDGDQERLISVLAYDWDGDGDRDLLLGSYENGHLYRQMNEGTDAEPKYTGRNIAVLAGGEPFAVAEKMTAPVLVDWDGDGDRDLVVGGFGDSYGDRKEGGGVYLSLNEGEEGAPRFGALTTLIEPSAFGAETATRPDVGLYPAVCDWDGDGDLDLLVGGYSYWTPPGRELTPEEQARVEELRTMIAAAKEAANTALRELNRAIIAATDGMERGTPEYDAAVDAVHEELGGAYDEADDALEVLEEELEELVPSQRTASAVWLYER